MKKYISLILAFVLLFGCVQLPVQAAWQQTDGKWYYYQNDTKVTGWFAYGPYWYYMNAEGEMLTGWLYYGAKWYFFDNTTGRMVTNKWVRDAGNWYYFDGNGHMVTGWLELGGAKYYLKPDGSMVTGTYTIDGKQHMFDSNGIWKGETSGKTGWAQEAGKWYYYEGGVKKTGWLDLKGTWYYLKPSGEMVTGWLEYGPVWYYFDGNGVMYQNKWLSYGGHWYYFNDIGRMHIGWLQLGSTWYYLTGTGTMAVGWHTIGADTYYFYASGAMATNTTVDGIQIGPDGKARRNSEPADLTTPEGRETAQAEIRYALSLLIDRNYIVDQITQYGQAPANTFVADGMADYGGGNFAKNANGGKGYYSVAPEDYEANFTEGIEILKKYYKYDEETGKFTNFPALAYIYNTNSGHKVIAEYLQYILSTVGITMTPEVREWNTFLSTRKEGNYTVARNGWVADYTDPLCFLDMWITESNNNDAQFGRDAHAALKMYDLDLTDFGYDIKVENGTWAQTYDVLVKQIKSCTDAATRYKLMHIAEDMLMATGCLTPLYYYTDVYMISPKVEGFYSTPMGYKFFQNTTVEGRGDSLAVSLSSEPDTLDPALNSTVDGATMLCNLFSGLAKWEQQADGTLEVVADCATELVEGVTNKDGTVTYTYTLKEGLKWSDGQPLTAKDFEFAWKRAASADLGAAYGYMFDVIKGYEEGQLAVTAKDNTTLEVTLNNAVAHWNELLAFPAYFPVRKDVVANKGWATQAATYVSNGAYTMSAWAHNSVITLTKNKNYHNAASVTMNEIKLYLTDDANTMLTNYKNGDWLLIDDVPTNEIAALKTEYPEEFVTTGQMGTYYINWNINKNLLPAS